MEQSQIAQIADHLKTLRKTSDTLADLASNFPAIAKNNQRLRACLAMMELEIGVESPKTD